MRKTSAIAVGKTIAKISLLLKKGGGSAAPGYYALKMYPGLIEDLVKQIPQNIIITGTNGKTTTAKMLSHIAKSHGLKVIRNKTGSNLERGIASSLILNSSLAEGKLNYDLGIWETDEAAFNTLVPKINPNLIILLNVYRDQLDRYGEIDNVTKKWAKTINKTGSDYTLIINADDINIHKLAKNIKNKVTLFGVKGYHIKGEGKVKSKKAHFLAEQIKFSGLNSTRFLLKQRGLSIPVQLPLSGTYNVYNALAAIAAGQHLNLPLKKTILSLKKYSSAFGRMEKFNFGYILLIKNPTGATEVIRTISPLLKSGDRLLIALNDNLADGTDVSWIWDTGFEQLPINNYQLTITCSGTRAYDLALRLKYAGFKPKQLHIEPDLKRALQASKRGLKGTLYVLPTYTAMLKLQKILAQGGIKKNYWEEE